MHYINYNSSSKFKSELRDNCGDYVYCNNFIAPIKSALAMIQYYLSCKTSHYRRVGVRTLLWGAQVKKIKKKKKICRLIFI